MPKIAPWHSDYVQRPVKFVRVKGGIFVCAGNNIFEQTAKAKILYNEMATPESESDWRLIHTVSGPGHYTYMYGAAFGYVPGNPAADPPKPGKPTFCMGGYTSNPDLPPGEVNLRQLILTSNDGQTWSESRVGPGNFVYVMGWNENTKQFYAQAQAVGGTSIDILESADGVAWHMAESIARGPLEFPASPLLEATGTPLIKDSDGKIAPNGGFFGWDRDRNIWIAPKPLVACYKWAESEEDEKSRTNIVEIIRKTIDPDTGAEHITRTERTVESMDVVTGVAGIDLVWYAAGYISRTDTQSETSVIACSIDDGNSWETVYSQAKESIGSTMIAASGNYFAQPPA